MSEENRTVDFYDLIAMMQKERASQEATQLISGYSTKPVFVGGTDGVAVNDDHGLLPCGLELKYYCGYESYGYLYPDFGWDTWGCHYESNAVVGQVGIVCGFWVCRS